MVEVGKKVNNFKLPNENGDIISLDSFKGKKVVIYFYPKDNTSGCTKQACSYKEMYDEFCSGNVVVIGISKDSCASHTKFKQKYELPFYLLSDEGLDVIKEFGVWQEKNMYGKKHFGIVRTTFLLDENGILLKIFDKVKPIEDPSKVIEYIKGM